MARYRKSAGEHIGLSHVISLGVLSRVCPQALIDEVLAQTGKGSQRACLLPAPAVVYYVMALSLYRDLPLEEVLRVVTEGLRFLGGTQMRLAGQAALSLARRRLGSEVMQKLAAQVLSPLAQPGDAGAWYRGMRLMALDGTCLDVPDEKANAEHFSYPRASRGHSAFPQARALALVECGSHAVTAAAIAPYTVGETTLAAQVLPRLAPDMLLLADRSFYGVELWKAARATGAHLLWRVRVGLNFPVHERLADGTYLSATAAGDVVRVIDYALTDGAQTGEPRYRLLTTLLDAPAEELAALYHERWEIEGVFDEIKAHLGGSASSTLLRSKTPDLVRQEFWGLLIAHFAVRGLMQEAARGRKTDPDRLSFMNAVRVIRRKMPQAAALPP